MPANWRGSPLKRAEASAIAIIGAPMIAALGGSLHWRVEGLDHLRFEGNGRRPIMAFWHGRVLTATYYFRNRGIVVMISETSTGNGSRASSSGSATARRAGRPRAADSARSCS